MNNKFFTSFLFVGLLITVSYGQTLVPDMKLPNQVPPPPDAAVLGKYGEISVNMTSGVPNISIPFYEIKTSKLSVPIQLNYDASGIKVDQIASWVGLQWDLDAGGIITRTVNGVDDLDAGAGYYAGPVPPLAANVTESDDNDWTTLEEESLNLTPYIDTQPDYFFYNFLGHSGQFVFGEDKSIIDIHHQEPLQIQYSGTNGPTFTIKDGAGNSYIFAAHQQQDDSYSFGTGPNPVKQNEVTAISTWYLSQIVSCDNTDVINFNYISDAAYTAQTENYSIVYNETGAALFGKAQPRVISNSMMPYNIQSTPLRLQSITFKNGEVTFYSSGPRNDEPEKQLDSIVVSRYDFPSQSYVKTKSMKLTYGYYQNGSTSRLQLDAVKINGSQNENGGNYSFNYNTGSLPNLEDNGKDLFGYYNGKSTNGTLVPKSSMDALMQSDINGADRNTYDTYLEHGVLTQINYPTGGYTQFTYEPNQYLTDASTQNVTQTVTANANTPHATITFTPTVNTVVELFIKTSGYSGNPSGTIKVGLYQNGKVIPGSGAIIDPVNGANVENYLNLQAGQQYTLEADCTVTSGSNDYATISAVYGQPNPANPSVAGGGLRVTTIKNFDINGNYLNGQMYKYGEQESGYGFLPISSTYFNTYNQNENFYYGESNPDDGILCEVNTVNYAVYSASSIYDCFNLSGQAVSYDEVAKYQIDQSGNPLGKSVYDYTLYHTTNVPGIDFSTPTITNTAYKGGQILAESDYSFSNNTYIPVKKILYSYQCIPGPQARALKVARKENVTGCYSESLTSGIYHQWEDVPIYSGSILPISQTTYDYNTDNPANYVISYRTLAYDNSAHLQPVTITDATSDNNVIVSNMFYPEEKAGIANLTAGQSTAIDQLVSMHNLTPLIQQSVTRGGSPVSLLKNDYQVWSTNHVYPSEVEFQKGSSTIEPRLSYLNYDAYGNILQASKTNGAPISYLWDYTGEYPIAEVTSAAQADIAYTSFEADGSGNWTISSTARTSTGLTGKQSYPLSGNTLSKSGLTASNTYVVSYWTTASSPLSITGTITGFPVKGFTSNGWTYYEYRVTGQTTISLASSTAQNIDEVRLYPLGSLMKSYTYDPLIGLTSSTDEKSEVSYYEYDGLQRLINIKDQSGNVIKHMSYHYQGQ